MCGIIGYKGDDKAFEVVMNGLKQLEYRGYDSWGIAAIAGDELKILKDIGKISEVQNVDIKSNIAIGHTRWATHGAVTKINAHPHFSMSRRIALVHNGIVENFRELKQFLEKNGFKFVSETDTEVIPNLIEYFLKDSRDLTEAFRKALLKIEGSFAVVAIDKNTKKIFFGRRGSPLVLGIGANEYFVASDVPAFLEHTKNAIYLDDNEYGVIDDKPTIYNLETNEKIEKKPKLIEWSLEQAKKGPYPHFMLKEILEQKFTVKKAAEQSPELIKKVTNLLSDAFGIFFVGCGTSYHACVSAAYVFAHIAKIHVNVVLASEFRNYEDFLTENTLVVALSQSGETADLLDAIKTAKEKGCKTVSVVNVMGSTLTRLCDANVLMNAGPEICVLSTKSYTSQLAILLLLAYSVAGRLGEGRALIKKVCDNVENVIDVNLDKLRDLAERIKSTRDFFLIGRDLAYPSALEGALKIKEVSYIHAEGFAGAELKHGTIALIEKGVPVIVLSTEHTRSLILSNAMEIRSRGGYIIGIDNENNELFDYFIKVPDVGNANPILMIIPIQIFAYYLALARGCDPDKPRNLAKSVTVK